MLTSHAADDGDEFLSGALGSNLGCDRDDAIISFSGGRVSGGGYYATTRIIFTAEDKDGEQDVTEAATAVAATTTTTTAGDEPVILMSNARGTRRSRVAKTFFERSGYLSRVRTAVGTTELRYSDIIKPVQYRDINTNSNSGSSSAVRTRTETLTHTRTHARTHF